jgi:hypothetical protein
MNAHDTEPHYVVASTFPPDLLGTYLTRHVAEAKATEANKSGARLQNGDPAHQYQAMTLDEFRAADRTYWLSRPLQEIPAAEFRKTLEDNVPIEWEYRDGVQRFSLPVPKQGPIYLHFAEMDGRCFQRFCDIYDPQTFITDREIAANCASEGQGHALRVV